MKSHELKLAKVSGTENAKLVLQWETAFSKGTSLLTFLKIS